MRKWLIFCLVGVAMFFSGVIYGTSTSESSKRPESAEEISLIPQEDEPAAGKEVDEHRDKEQARQKRGQMLSMSLSGDDWQLKPLWKSSSDVEDHGPAKKQWPLVAVATRYNSRVYAHNKDKPVVIGYVHYGNRVRAKQAVEAPGCSRGEWHPVEGDGLVCTTDGFDVATNPPNPVHRYAIPIVSMPEPYRYAKAKKGVPRFRRIPTAEEEKFLADASRAQAAGHPAVEDILDGIYFVGIDRLVEQDDRSYYHTTTDRYLRKGDVEVLYPTRMHGEPLGRGLELPIAFVFGKARQTFKVTDAGLEEHDSAAKHTRFEIERVTKFDGKEYAVSPEGIAVARNEVRMAERVSRPESLPEKVKKWMHIDLAQQTLVAYESEEPVFVTLVSSGIKGRDTPTGLYPIERKYVTKTMVGKDDVEGVYEVGEVPWCFYYRGNYAVHGAYWHNVFGETRSHGCTNIPPADARWLFRFFDPKMPEGWNATLNRERGWAWFTN